MKLLTALALIIVLLLLKKEATLPVKPFPRGNERFTDAGNGQRYRGVYTGGYNGYAVFD